MTFKGYYIRKKTTSCQLFNRRNVLGQIVSWDTDEIYSII